MPRLKQIQLTLSAKNYSALLDVMLVDLSDTLIKSKGSDQKIAEAALEAYSELKLLFQAVTGGANEIEQEPAAGEITERVPA
ncbi:MAG: hypothetical protein IIB69_13850 [Proteobacteria bacterium]|nr:hypothetical protein [Pseudomonadota bacterium]